MSRTKIKGRLTLRTWRDGEVTNEVTAENVMCIAGLGDLAAAIAWSAAQDQGSTIGAIESYLTPVYGAVGVGSAPPYSITGAIAAGSTVITPYTPAQISFTGTLSSGSNVITGIASTTGVYQGMQLTELAGDIPVSPATTVLSTTSTTITMSTTATGSITETINAAYPFTAGQIVQDASGGIPAFTAVLSSTPTSITMDAAATSSTLSLPNALDIPRTGTTSATSSTISVTSGALILVAGSSYNGTTPSLAISDTLGTLTWTKIQFENTTSFATPFVFWAVASSTTTGTVTVTNTGSSQLLIQPFQVTGQAVSPIGATYTGNGPSGALSSAPGPNSMIFSVAEEATVGTAPVWTIPNAMTSLMPTTNQGRMYVSMAYDLGNAYQNIMWMETNPVGPALLAVEILPNPSDAIVVGTSNSDTDLYSELTRAQVSAVAASPSSGSGSTTLMQFQFPSNPVDYTLTEAGVFTLADGGSGDGDLFDHALFSPGFLWSNGDTLTLSAEFIWNYP